MNPATLQLINTIFAALIIAAILGIAKVLMGKADKATVAKDAEDHEQSDAKEHARFREELGRMEVKLEAALLVVGAAITRPELAEKILTMTGRSDDRMARVLADIVQMNTDIKAVTKANTDTDKKLDDLPSRVRSLEENQKRN